MPLRQRDRLGAVVPEIPPWPLMKFTGDAEALHVVADDVLRTVGRTGVHHDPVVDVGGDGIDQLMDDV